MDIFLKGVLRMIIVTGATGHIGNSVIRLLRDKKESFRILARKSGPGLEEFQDVLRIGDLFDPRFLTAEVHPGDVLIHLAGLIDLTNQKKEEMKQVNEEGTRIITDFCFQTGVKLVYTSSVDAIAKKDAKSLVNEPTEFYPESFKKSVYSATKAAGTAYVYDKMTHNGMNAVILYPSAVFGVHDYKPSAIGKEIRACLDKNILFYFSGGYDFIDVRDTAMAIYQAAIRPVRGSYILSGYPVTIREFFAEIAKNLDQKVHLIRIPVAIARIGAIFLPDVSQMMVDALVDNYNYVNTRMKTDLLPELIPFSQSVRDTVEWFKKESTTTRNKTHPTPSSAK
jgi:dihydroflavonol-4-reductase